MMLNEETIGENNSLDFNITTTSGENHTLEFTLLEQTIGTSFVNATSITTKDSNTKIYVKFVDEESSTSGYSESSIEYYNSLNNEFYVVFPNEEKFDCLKGKLVNVSDYYELQPNDSLPSQSSYSSSSTRSKIVEKNSITIMLMRNLKTTADVQSHMVLTE